MRQQAMIVCHFGTEKMIFKSVSPFSEWADLAIAPCTTFMQACGCLFHFKQAVRRNLSQKGLITLYHSCHRFQYLVHML
jgi:hypothetical protein